MSGKKLKTLFLSISVLVLLIIVYSGYAKGAYRHKEADSDSKTAATIVMEAASKTSKFFSNSYHNLKAKHEQKKMEKLSRQKALEASENVTFQEADSLDEEPLEEEITQFTDYEEPYAISIPDDMEIPLTVGDITFRTDSTYVYAKDVADLYGDPLCVSGTIEVTKEWEEFLRVGISADCCYQLISGDGKLYYADGSHFKRFREDMPLTEVVNMEKERVLLDVNYVSQFPSLPNGCEVTSLTTVLQYLGYDISKDELAKDYLPQKRVGDANFFNEFVGNPAERNSYGCFAPVIVKTADAYLESIESPLRATDLTGASFQSLLQYVREGTPVMVWGAGYIETEPKDATEWIVDGEYLIWKDNLHCMVLIGYDLNEKMVIVSDPMRGIKEYDMDLFIKRYKQMYSQAVILE